MLYPVVLFLSTTFMIHILFNDKIWCFTKSVRTGRKETYFYRKEVNISFKGHLCSHTHKLTHKFTTITKTYGKANKHVWVLKQCLIKHTTFSCFPCKSNGKHHAYKKHSHFTAVWHTFSMGCWLPMLWRVLSNYYHINHTQAEGFLKSRLKMSWWLHQGQQPYKHNPLTSNAPWARQTFYSNVVFKTCILKMVNNNDVVMGPRWGWSQSRFTLSLEIAYHISYDHKNLNVKELSCFTWM